jgi:hypothetical protein
MGKGSGNGFAVCGSAVVVVPEVVVIQQTPDRAEGNEHFIHHIERLAKEAAVYDDCVTIP